MPTAFGFRQPHMLGVFNMKHKYYIQCPNCGYRDSFRYPKIKPLIPQPLAFGMPFPLATMRGLKRASLAQCNKCDHIFKRPSKPESSVAKLFRDIMGVIVLSIVIVLLLSIVIPNSSFYNIIETYMFKNTIWIFFIFMLCAIIYFISNLIFRYRIAKEYQLTEREKNNKANSADAKSSAAD